MRTSLWSSVAKTIGLGLMLLLLAGCVAYPGGLVVRHAEGLVVRSQCPPATQNDGGHRLVARRREQRPVR